MARTWSPGLPLWSHTEERGPGGAVASVARVSFFDPHRRSGGGRDAEEGGAGLLEQPLLEEGGVGGGRPPPARRYEPPTLPIIPPPPPRVDGASGDGEASARRAAWATRVSLAANVLLLTAKVAAYALSGSKAVLASALDSLVDLASQAILAAAAAAAARTDTTRFPVGKARMTTVGVATAAGLMLFATSLVVQGAVQDLYEGLAHGSPPVLVVGPALFVVLLGGTALKALLFVLCARAVRAAPPGSADALAALAEDHRTDALTNVVAAAAAAAVVAGGPPAWPVDPVAALLLSAYILAVWGRIFARTVNKLVGRGAPPDVMAALEAVCASHAPSDIAAVDVLKAWYAGESLICEAEIVMSPDAPLRLTHDVALSLQHALEAVRCGDVAVERAYVHVDYARRAEPEHAPDRAAAAAERRAGR